MRQANANIKRSRNKFFKKNAKDILFYILLLVIPVTQFCIFYVGVNFNSLLLAFREGGKGAFTTQYITNAAKGFFVDPAWTSALGYSIKSYLISTAIAVPLGLFFSYYISKKLFGHALFRVILFLPSILSALVMVSIYNKFIYQAGWDFTSNFDTAYGAVMAFNIWISFGTTVLMYSNAMSAIPPELMDAAKIDGANTLQEFWHITLPQVFSTLSVFLVVGVAAIFTNQYNLFSFYGTREAKWETIGYRLYLLSLGAKSSDAQKAPVAAVGVILTLVAVPLTFFVRWLLNKFGPSEER